MMLLDSSVQIFSMSIEFCGTSGVDGALIVVGASSAAEGASALEESLEQPKNNRKESRVKNEIRMLLC